MTHMDIKFSNDSRDSISEAVADSPSHRSFYEQLSRQIPAERIITNSLAREVLSRDASTYRLLPRLVVLVRCEQEVQALLRCARDNSIGITFRAAGTSLSGQAVTDSVLVQLDTPFWRQVRISDDGGHIALGPSVTGGAANAALAPYGRKIGPDPASLASAQIGGIVANNASGMCCGTEQNSYRTIESMRLLLFDGTILDTGDLSSRAAFEQSHASLLAEITLIAKEIKTDNVLRTRVIEKYKMKNTMGYGLNSFIDYDDPIDILAHAVVGSEGSLAFLSEARYHTIEDARHKTANLVFFQNFEIACRAVIRLKSSGATAALEIADRQSFRCIEQDAHFPEQGRNLDDACAFLLIDAHGSSAEEVAQRCSQVVSILEEFPILYQTGFTRDAQTYKAYWDIRKEIYPSLGRSRAPGTFFMQEDLVFPLERLAEAALALRAAFNKHGYKDDSVIFGHASDGNLHACLSLDLSSKEGMARYEGLVDELVTMVIDRFDGALKGEHGTGRNMAPFVVREWGAKALSLMRRLKLVMDPAGILNPGVIINDDPNAHISHLKQFPQVGSAADLCTECGFCERVCPTASYTMTPRQRIVALRTRAERKFSRAEEAYFRRAAVSSCVGDSLCHQVCPVGIDTGELMRRVLAEQHSRFTRFLAGLVERRFAFSLSLVRAMLRCLVFVRAGFGSRFLAKIRLPIGLPVAKLLQRLARLFGLRFALEFFAQPPRAQRRGRGLLSDGEGEVAAKPSSAGSPSFVFFPSCASRLFGSTCNDDVPAMEETIASLCHKSSIVGSKLQAAENFCCGLAFHSKGYYESAHRASQRLHAGLPQDVRDGLRPLVCDAAPCALRLQSHASFRAVDVLDSITFARKFLLPSLQKKIKPSSRRIIAHLPCSSRRAGLEKDFLSTLEVLSQQAPLVATKTLCCGFGGDLGFRDAALNKQALAGLLELASEVSAEQAVVVSASRTCEIGLAWHSGLPCYSLLAFLDRQSNALAE